MRGAADTVVVGGGVVGLCVATALATRGHNVVLVSESRPGEASAAAAGMLAPSVERAAGPAHRFAIAARDLYPSYLEELADATGIRVPLNRLGVLQVALTGKGEQGLRKTASAESHWIERADLAELEPTLGHALGAVYNPNDGAVDNVILLAALSDLVDRTSRISRFGAAAVEIERTSARVRVRLSTGETLEADHVVAAPGAWGASLAGAPALRPVEPSRGQLVSYRSIGIRHVTYGPRGYLVPRMSGTTVAGTTMENVGFETDTTPDGIARVRSAAEEIAPALCVAPITAAWAGLRPVTPDMLPIIGPDPENPALVYACGHSRNGILLAPLTGKTVAALISGDDIAHDLSQFRPGRF